MRNFDLKISTPEPEKLLQGSLLMIICADYNFHSNSLYNAVVYILKVVL